MSAQASIIYLPQPSPDAPPEGDHREHHRRQAAMDLWLTDLSGETVLRCQCHNLSAGGLFAIAPVGFGLAVGQRYELRIAPTLERGSSLLLGDSLGYATVIRTQLRADADRSELRTNHRPPLPNDATVGFAVRFDTPQYLPV